MLKSTFMIDNLQQQLEAVTGQTFQLKVIENTDSQLLCSWQNDTHVDYIMHVMKIRFDAYQLAFAIQKYNNIETRFDKRMSRTELFRLISDPRLCVRLMLGQQSISM